MVVEPGYGSRNHDHVVNLAVGAAPIQFLAPAKRPSWCAGRMTIAKLLAAGAFLTLVQAPIAHAEPFDGPLIATTCSYAQLHSALQVEAPKLAAELDARPAAQDKLQRFIALPVDQRKQKLTEVLDRNPEWRAKLDEKRNTPEGQEKVAMLRRIADTCGSY